MHRQDFEATHHHIVSSDHHVTWTRYWNSSGFAGAIVAAILFDRDGEMVDWAAYIGGCDRTWSELDAVEWIVDHGNKLPRSDGQYFFPALPVEYYRE